MPGTAAARRAPSRGRSRRRAYPGPCPTSAAAQIDVALGDEEWRQNTDPAKQPFEAEQKPTREEVTIDAWAELIEFVVQIEKAMQRCLKASVRAAPNPSATPWKQLYEYWNKLPDRLLAVQLLIGSRRTHDHAAYLERLRLRRRSRVRCRADASGLDFSGERGDHYTTPEPTRCLHIFGAPGGGGGTAGALGTQTH